MTGLVTNGTLDGLTRMEHTYRKIKHRHRRRKGTKKRHDETTIIIGYGWKIAKETLMDGVHNTKGFESTSDIVIGHFDWKVTHKDGSDMLVSGSNWY